MISGYTIGYWDTGMVHTDHEAQFINMPTNGQRQMDGSIAWEHMPLHADPNVFQAAIGYSIVAATLRMAAVIGRFAGTHLGDVWFDTSLASARASWVAWLQEQFEKAGVHKSESECLELIYSVSAKFGEFTINQLEESSPSMREYANNKRLKDKYQV